MSMDWMPCCPGSGLLLSAVWLATILEGPCTSFPHTECHFQQIYARWGGDDLLAYVQSQHR